MCVNLLAGGSTAAMDPAETTTQLADSDATQTSHAQDNAPVAPETPPTSKPKKKKKKKKPSGPSTTDLSFNHKSSTVSGASVSVERSIESSSQSSFEQELQWCIAQLELGLLRKDDTKSQKQENDKFIRTLRSQKIPLPRKRQVMKNLFGDYRTRILREPVSQYLQTPDSAPSVSGIRGSEGGRFFRHSIQKDSRGKGVNGEGSGVDGVNGECSGIDGVNSESSGVDRVNGGKRKTGFCFNFEIEP